ncbi:MAG: tetraacyldisaccharide 4'-kinase [Phycisphaerales bacterium]
MSAAGRVPQRGPLGVRLGPLGTLLGRVAEPFYRGAVALRNRRYDRGRGVHALPVPVISVGNLTVGGTGKSPMAAWVVREVQRAGFRPAVAMRGYGAKWGGAGFSDEAEEYRLSLPGVPVAVGAHRLSAIRAMFGATWGDGGGRGVECIVLDDGFQHRRLRRDLDIVLIDATRDILSNRLLPAGWLREPIESLRRAQVVVLTHMEAADERLVDRLIHRIRAARGPADPVRCRHEWTGLDGLSGSDGDTTVWLRGRKVLSVCAIGNPRPFLARVRREAGESCVVGEIVLPDHDPFHERTVARVIAEARGSGAQAIVATNKDWAKLKRVPPERWPCPVVRPRLTMLFDHGEDELRAAVAAVQRREGADAGGSTTVGGEVARV